MNLMFAAHKLDGDSKGITIDAGDGSLPPSSLTANKLRRERQSLGFRWLSGVEAKGTQGGGQFASTPLSERLT